MARNLCTVAAALHGSGDEEHGPAQGIDYWRADDADVAQEVLVPSRARLPELGIHGGDSGAVKIPLPEWAAGSVGVESIHGVVRRGDINHIMVAAADHHGRDVENLGIDLIIDR